MTGTPAASRVARIDDVTSDPPLLAAGLAVLVLAISTAVLAWMRKV